MRACTLERKSELRRRSRHGGDIVAWPRAVELPELPVIHQIIRTVPGEAPAVATALVDAIAQEMLDPVA